MTEYAKEDDYTLRAIQNLPTGGTLSRYFNFAAGQIVTIFSQKAEMSDKIQSSRYSEYPVATSVSTALTSQMHVQNFSSLDYTAELEQMHAILKEQGGNPPALDEKLIKKIDKPSKGPLG
jgi:alkyl hydroperoxide reductase subunit AhpF